MTSRELKKNAKLQEWTAKIKECRSSGKTVNSWCREQHIDKSTYYRWERELLKIATNQVVKEQACPGKLTPVCFEEVGIKKTESMSIIQESNLGARTSVATLRYGSVTLDIYSGADAATLASLMKAMNLC